MATPESQGGNPVPAEDRRAQRKKANALLIRAAQDDDPKEMRRVKAEGATNFDEALRVAAEGGRIRAMHLAHKWGGTCLDNILRAAAENGQLKAMELARRWGGVKLNGTLLQATAARGQTGALFLLRDWGASIADLYGALIGAAEGGHPELMDRMAFWVADQHRIESKILDLEAYQAELNLALVLAAEGGHVAAMQKARALGAKSYSRAAAAGAEPDTRGQRTWRGAGSEQLLTASTSVRAKTSRRMFTSPQATNGTVPARRRGITPS